LKIKRESACNGTTTSVGDIMKLFSGLLVTAMMFAAPAWADEPKAQISDVFNQEVSRAAPIDWFENFVVSSETLENRSLLTSPQTESEEFGLEWTRSGRWGLTLDVVRRDGDQVSALPENEFSAGAFYQFSPSFRLGGGISISGERQIEDSSRFADEEAETNVRIESAFSF
jgi:hypothetical protein